MASTPPKDDNSTPPSGKPTPPALVNPYAKSSASPKSKSKKKKAAKKKAPVEPSVPLGIENLPELSKKPHGTFDYPTLGRAESTQETRKQAIKLYDT